MLTLLLLRHAKSSWDNWGSSDFDRPLAKRGIKAAPRMGAEIATLGLRPDLILCSSAARTRQTLSLVLPELGEPAPDVVYDEAIYMAEPETLLATIRNIAYRARPPRRAMIVGHNPGMENLADMLTGAGDAAGRALMADKFPTCALAVLEFDTDDWRSVAAGNGTLEHFLTPALLT